MRVLISAPLDELWQSVFMTLRAEFELEVVYWVGRDEKGVTPPETFFHDTFDAFALKNLNKVKREPFDISLVERKDYYTYQKILDRYDYAGYFTFSERDGYFKKQMDYWVSVISKYNPDLVFFSNAPHMAYDYPIYIASKICGSPTFMMHVSPFHGWHYGGRDIGQIVKTPFKKNERHDPPKYEEVILPFLFGENETLWYIEKQQSISDSLKRRLKASPLRYISEIFKLLRIPSIADNKRKSFADMNDRESLCKTTESLYGEAVPGRFRRAALGIRFAKEKKKLRKIMESSVSEINLNNDFFYYPLQYQPEQTTSPLGGDFSDQIYLLREISKALPEGCDLLVKEHPSQFLAVLQGNFGRFPGYWKEIASIDNVKLVPSSTCSRDLLEKSLGVVTVTGTAGWEAIVNGKPCLFFGSPWYQRFPQAIACDLKGLKKTLSEVSSGELSVPQFRFSSAERFFFDFCIKCDLHVRGKKDVEKDAIKVVDYLAQYCFTGGNKENIKK